MRPVLWQVLLGLGKLVVLYDDNNISIDGEVDGWFTEDIPARFQSYGWEVISNVNGHDPEEINAAIEKAKTSQDKPTLICCKTIIGKGSPNKEGTASTHGSPLGEEEIAEMRKDLRWDNKPFDIPDSVYEAWDAKEQGNSKEEEWNQLFDQYQKDNEELASELRRIMNGDLPEGVEEAIYGFVDDVQKDLPNLATRVASQKVLNVLGPISS